MSNLQIKKVVKNKYTCMFALENDVEYKRNNHAIDIMKYVCAILVILVHASTILSFPPVFRYIIVNVLSRIAVPFFFLSSAYFLAKNLQTRGMPYFKNYIWSFCKNYIFWSILYMPIGILWLQDNMMLEWYLYPFALLIAVFYIGMYYPLWYLPAFISAIFVVYIWQKHFRLQWLLLLSFVLLCFGALETYYGVLPDGPLLTIFKMYIKHFITTRNFLFFALFYVTCGFIIARHNIMLKMQVARVLSIIFFLCLLIEAYFLTQTEALDFNILLFAAPFTFCIFSYLHKVSVHMNINFKNLRILSEHYYYLHGFVLVFVSYLLNSIHYFSLGQCLVIILILTHYASVLWCLMKEKLSLVNMSLFYKFITFRRLQ